MYRKVLRTNGFHKIRTFQLLLYVCRKSCPGTRHRLMNWTCGGDFHARDRLALLAAASSSCDDGDVPGVRR